MENDDDELFDMLNRELSRSCNTLLDHSFEEPNRNNLNMTRGVDDWDVLHQYDAAEGLVLRDSHRMLISQDIHRFPHLELQFQQQQQLEDARRQQVDYMLLLLQAEKEQIRILNHQNGRNRTITSSSQLKQIDLNNNKHLGVRGLIIGDAGAQLKLASAGTGVFLPRSPTSTLSQPSNIIRNNKPGFPSVMVPERVLQALNQNLERMRNVPRPPGLRQW